MSDDPILQALIRMEHAMNEVLADLGGVKADLTAIRRDMVTREELFAVRVAIMDRIDRVQDTLTAIRDDVGVAMGSADAMQRANDNTRELVRIQGEQMTIFFRKLQRLEEQVRALRGDP